MRLKASVKEKCLDLLLGLRWGGLESFQSLVGDVWRAWGMSACQEDMLELTFRVSRNRHIKCTHILLRALLPSDTAESRISHKGSMTVNGDLCIACQR